MATQINKRLDDLEKAANINPGEIPIMAAYPPEGEDWKPEYLNTLTGEITPELPENGVIFSAVAIRISEL